MKITEAPIGSIVPYEFNNRRHGDLQIERIAKSIKEFGFNQPIVIDEGRVILIGHGRLLAAQTLGLAKVPVLQVTGLTDTQKRSYRILDNKLQNDSDWDFDNLGLELGFLEDNGVDLGSWGLDDLQALFPDTTDDAKDDGFEIASDRETNIQRGDLIELGAHRVMCGDSTSGSDIERLLAGVTIEMVLTDPPYGVSYVGKTEEKLTIENDGLSDAELDELFRGVLASWGAHVRPGGASYTAAPPGPLCLVFENALRDAGILRQGLVWVKDSMVLGHSDYHYEHEPILYGWWPGGSHRFTDDRTKTSILRFARPKRSREHPTMKPVELWAELMANSSKRGDIVADPFLGSGTTVIAAEQMGRKCYGMEIDPRYCQVIIDRYAALCEKENVPFICKINGEPYETLGVINGEART